MALGLEDYTREQLIQLLEITAKDLMAIDGTWFQSLEREQGMDEAVHHDQEAWRRFMPSEAYRIRTFLGLDEHSGLEGLAKALPLRCTSLANEWEIVWEDDGSLLFRITDCRVQNARKRKGMEFHPCKSVGIIEYSEFARAFDERIQCACVSCFPDITDDTCNCAWRFYMTA